MDTFLQLPVARRLLAFQQVDEAMGLQAVSVEKDFWVCWTLRELFLMPGIGQHLTFKGGTSLSKAWKLIERFSEDIDIIVDKEVLGFGGEAAPDRAASNKQRKARLESLMDACCEWVQGKLQPALASRMQSALGNTGWQLEVDPDMPDGQCLLFHYPSVFPAGAVGYVRPVVKIELGARSDDWPHEEKPILPYVIEYFPALDPTPSLFVSFLPNALSGKKPACFTKRPLGLPGNRGNFAWLGTTMTSGVCFVPVSVKKPLLRLHFSSALPSTANSSSASHG